MRRDAGFSLLETLVAFVVLSIALTTLLPALSDLTKRSGQTERTWRASEIASSVLAEARVLATTGALRTSGSWERYRWRLTERPYSLEGAGVDPRTRMVEMEIEVRWSPTDEVLLQMHSLRHARARS